MFRIFKRPLCFLTGVLMLGVLPAGVRAQQSYPEDFEDYYEAETTGPNKQEELRNAQATLSSLFGSHKAMAIPPQIAGGTIALPSFDRKGLEIEKEAVTKDQGMAAEKLS